MPVLVNTGTTAKVQVVLYLPLTISLTVFSATRMYAIYERNVALAVLVGILSMVPVGWNAVRIHPRFIF